MVYYLDCYDHISKRYSWRIEIPKKSFGIFRPLVFKESMRIEKIGDEEIEIQCINKEMYNA